jgi:hypothetical protein
MKNVLLYQNLTRFGNFYQLNTNHDADIFLNNIKQFDNDWKPYNKRKNIPREGLSITSLDGRLSGIPDLDSLYEYNKENNTSITELDIDKPTSVYEYALPYFKDIAPYVCRTHVIRLNPCGSFPIHRDNKSYDIDSFRLFVPLNNCNPPVTYFILEDKILRFLRGYVYFIDTCLEHVVFNASESKPSTFVVINVKLCEESVDAIIKNLRC